MIHRDIKPANLLLGRGDTVKITDFGIAHAVGSAAVTPSGEIMGTPGYRAPEQVAGEQVTPATACPAGPAAAKPGHDREHARGPDHGRGNAKGDGQGNGNGPAD